jgi:polar amino acid transport system substrate-binding protein
MRFPALIVLLLIGTVAVASETGELRLVSTVWPPFTDVAEKPRLAAELVHEALKRGGVDAETYIVPDPELVSSMRDGSHAGSGALWRSPERERFLLYSKPYMENRLVLVGRKGSSVRAQTLRWRSAPRPRFCVWQPVN